MNIGEANDTQRLLKVLVGLNGLSRPKDPGVWDAAERLADRSNKALGAGMTSAVIRYERPKTALCHRPSVESPADDSLNRQLETLTKVETTRCHACKAVVLADSEVCGRCNADLKVKR